MPFAAISDATKVRLSALLDPGLEPTNPLDVWGTGARAESVLEESLLTLAEDSAVAALALAVDLVTELDGDLSYPRAGLAAARRTAKPLAVLTGFAGGVDPGVAAELRCAGVPVLEGTRTGLLALGHLLDHARWGAQFHHGKAAAAPGGAGRNLAAGLLSGHGAGAARLFELLREYGIPATRVRSASTQVAARAVVRAGRPILSHDDIERAVVLRMTRQEILTHEAGPPIDQIHEPRFWAIIDGSALHRVVGSPEIMREQREHLASMAQQSNITIQVMPYSQGATCAFGRAFTILVTKKFGSVVYLEDVSSARYARGDDEVSRYVLVFDHLRATALDEEASINLIKGDCK